jgi:hypothetical protein
MYSTRQSKAGVRQDSPDQIRCTVVLVGAVQRELMYSGSLLSPALCGIMWSRDVQPSSTQATHIPLLKLLIPPPKTFYCRLSLPAALQRDGPERSRPRRSTRNQIHDQWMPNDVSLHCIYFALVFLVEHSSKHL